MAVFEFAARDMTGKRLTGKLECDTRNEALEDLMRREVVPISVKKVRSLREFFPPLGKRVKPEELILFSRQLMTMIKAGIHLLTCLHSLRIQAQHPLMRSVIEGIYKDVSEGSSLSDAMAKHPRVFNDIYVSMIRVGEEGGVLDEVFERLIALLEHDAETRAALKQAVRYPLMVLIGLGGCFLVVTLFVLPRFGQLYARFGADLPLPTRVLLGINTVLHDHGIAALVILILACVLVIWSFRTEKGRWRWHAWRLKIPVLGPLFVRIAITRFARTFAMLDKCGLPILRNLEIVADTVGNLVIAREVMMQRECVRMGKSIAEPLKDSQYFPPLVSEMLAIGETSGSTAEVLAAVSDHYDREIRYTMKNLTTLIEPLITLVMGVFVLFMAIAVFMPMWKMTGLIKR
jgi:type II secretory pathway component PulF